MGHCRKSRHLFNALGGGLFLAIAFVAVTAFAQQSAISDYLYYDNNFNVIQRLRTEDKKIKNLMSEDDKKPVDVNLYEISLQSGSSNLTVSQFVTRSDFEKVQASDGKIYVPVLETDPLNKIFRLKFGPPRFQTKARKVLSRATYFIEPV